MNFRKLVRPSALFLMAGLLPVTLSPARAQSRSMTSLLSASVTTLPSERTLEENDPSNFDLLGDFTTGETDSLGGQSVSVLSHSGSGSNSGWLIGGTLGATAGLAGLISGHSSAATASLRTPATTVFPIVTGSKAPSVSGSNPASIGGGNVAAVSGANALTLLGAANSNFAAPRPDAVFTPEPGFLGLLSGMGLMFTAIKMRRRKR